MLNIVETVSVLGEIVVNVVLFRDRQPGDVVTLINLDANFK